MTGDRAVRAINAVPPYPAPHFLLVGWGLARSPPRRLMGMVTPSVPPLQAARESAGTPMLTFFPLARSGTWCAPRAGRCPWSRPRTCWAGCWAASLLDWPVTGKRGSPGQLPPQTGVTPCPAPLRGPVPRQVRPPSRFRGVPGAGGAPGPRRGAGCGFRHGPGRTAALRGGTGGRLPLALRGT